MNPSFKIGNLHVGLDYEPLVIAEIGINHNGSIDTALKMVESAKNAGAKIIKHQTHIISDEMSQEAKKTIPGNASKSIYDIMSDCALTLEEEIRMQQHAKKLGMEFISSPFSRAAAERLQSMGVPAFKVGSGECNNFPLLKLIASYKKPVILSTGMNDIKTVKTAVNIFKENNVPVALLHCTNVYPTPYNLVRLNCLKQLQDAFPECPTGLSDHSESIYPCLGAVALGATILERHYTDTMQRSGPDIPVSMDENECKRLIQGSKAIWESRGGDKNALLQEEQITRDFAYASVVAIKDIQKGETFTKDNIWVKRPGTGEILAADYESLLNKSATTNIINDSLLSWSQVSK